MKFWISKNSEVPVREQLTTQVTLAVASGELKTGDRLPSTREIARRFGIHSNTVAAAYRALVESRTIEFRRGSGYYVTAVETSGTLDETIDNLLDHLLKTASAAGLKPDDIIDRIRLFSARHGARKILIVESDAGLREILVHEITAATNADVNAITFERFAEHPSADGVVVAALFDEKPKIDPLLTDGNRCFYMSGRSVAGVLSAEVRPDDGETIGIISGWNGFLDIARVMLAAARIDLGRTVVRSTFDEGWSDAIGGASMVICDSLTAHRFSELSDPRVFRVISDESLMDLSNLINTEPGA